MRLLSLPVLLSALATAGPLSILDDRGGRWEASWKGGDWTILSRPSGVAVRQFGLGHSAHEGDLDAPRLRALLAIPAGSAWNLEIVEDSGRILSSRNWARIPHMDPSTGRTSPVPASQPPSWTERTTGGIKLVSLDLPLAQLQPDGSMRVRTRLKVRATWSGTVRPADGTAWKNLVDNPGGIGPRLAARGASRAFGSLPGDPLAGQLVAVEVGDTAISGTLEDGVVRLTGAQLYQVTGMAPGSASWGNIALYGASADTVSAANAPTVPGPNLRLLPLRKLDRNGDGTLDLDDEIWFWARGTSIWKPDADLPGGWRFSIHPYSRTRRYFVRLDAPSGSPELGTPRPAATAARWPTVPQPVWGGEPRQLLEQLYQESTLDPNTGTSWFWQYLRETSSLDAGTFTVPSTSNLPGIVGDSAYATLYVASTRLSNSYPGEVQFLSGSGAGIPVASDMLSSTYTLHGLSQSGNRYWLDNAQSFMVSGYTVTYRRDVSRSDSLAFPAPSSGAVSVPVGATGNCWVLEHGDAVRTCSLSDGALRDSVTDPDTWYAVFGSSPGSRPVRLSAITAPVQSHAITDFSQTGSLDMVVVAPGEFMDLAEEYATWRGNSKQIRPMSVGVARLQDIWDRWSGGAMDPAGLRNALRWFWSQRGISHALLMGAGHADPRGIRHPADAVRIPVWEDKQVSTDDFFTWFDSTGLHAPKIALGRVPARSASEARAWLSKVEVFEEPKEENLGPWRNTALFVADDQWQGAKIDNLPHSTETSEIADLAESQHPWLRANRFYEQLYPKDAANFKPAATQALVGYLNQGVAAFNYMGHGAPTILSDELLLDAPSFQRSVTNSTRPFFFFAGSCTVGRHDDPDVRSLADLFTVTAGKGAFTSIGGMRPTYSEDNTALSLGIWGHLLDTTTAPRTTGEALQAAKLLEPESNEYSIQDLYNILGDPAIIVFPHRLSVGLDPIPDSLSALSKLTLSGSTSASGKIQIRLDHPLQNDTFEDSHQEVVRTTPQQLLSTTTDAASGRFSTSLLLPARLPLGDSARFSAYVWDPSTRRDGGARGPIKRLSGVGSEIPSDKSGPTLNLRSCNPSWSAGITYGKIAMIPLPFCLQVDIQDSSGISTETGPDDGVVFSLSGARDPWHPDVHQGVDYRNAYAQFTIDSSLVLPGSTYTFQVTARDLMGNLSRASVQIQPQARGEYALYDVFNSPNPVRDGTGTTFYYKLASNPDSSWGADTRIESSIRIHTLSGKLVKILRTELSQPTQPRPRATWDLLDSHGRPVANGLYPYTVTLRIPDANGVSSTDLVQRGIVAVSR